MSCLLNGARVHMLSHGLVFSADLYEVEGAMVVRANGPLTPRNTWRANDDGWMEPTHELLDDHGSGFWREDLGIFVVAKLYLREKAK
jgi:hypothetical protein